MRRMILCTPVRWSAPLRCPTPIDGSTACCARQGVGSGGAVGGRGHAIFSAGVEYKSLSPTRHTRDKLYPPLAFGKKTTKIFDDWLRPRCSGACAWEAMCGVRVVDGLRTDTNTRRCRGNVEDVQLTVCRLRTFACWRPSRATSAILGASTGSQPP